MQLVPDLATFDTPASLEFLDNVGGLRLLMALRTAAQDPSAKGILKNGSKQSNFRCLFFFRILKSSLEVLSRRLSLSTSRMTMSTSFDLIPR